MTPAVGRDLETVFRESDKPARQNDFPQGGMLEPEVAVPGEGHENIGNGEENYRSHVLPRFWSECP